MSDILWLFFVAVACAMVIVILHWTEDDTAYVLQQWQRFDGWTAELLARAKRKRQTAVWQKMERETKKRHR